MKNLGLVLILVILCLFITCDDELNNSANNHNQTSGIIVPGSTLVEKLQWCVFRFT